LRNVQSDLVVEVIDAGAVPVEGPVLEGVFVSGVESSTRLELVERIGGKRERSTESSKGGVSGARWSQELLEDEEESGIERFEGGDVSLF